MQKALVFFLAVLALAAIVYGSPKTEPFQNLMGVNWTSMNDGTPAALYTKLPIQQPKGVAVAEAGVGNIQPSPPPPSDLPTAPAGLRSKETPNPYRDPTMEPAKYIRILAVKEDLQAFFGFQAQALETRSDPAIQIPLNRARADMKELIDTQSVMERNPGIQSRITQKHLDDIQSNLRYLRAMLHDLEASGAIQQTAFEGFEDSSAKDPFIQKSNEVIKTYQLLQQALSTMIPPQPTQVFFKNAAKGVDIPTYITSQISNVLGEQQRYSENPSPTKFPMYAKLLNRDYIQEVNAAINSPVMPRTSKLIPPVVSLELTPTLSLPSLFGTNSSPTVEGFEGDDEPRATLKQLQEFQVKIVVEIQRLNASGTSDPVIKGRLNVLDRIKNEVDDVITKIESGFYTPETVPIFASDIKKALPVLGNTSAPVPQLLQKTGLPPAIASLLPNGGSPRDNEMAAQINNVVKGYMTNLFEGVSWGLNLNVKYDNPNIVKLQAETAEANAKLAGTPSTGLPGVRGTGTYSGAETGKTLYQSDTSNKVQTKVSYDYGLPGSSTERNYPQPKAGGLDWEEKSKQIREQIRRRGMNPVQFGALPEGATVSSDFSWRGYTRMICSRLNASMDPGLGVTVGCPPENWPGWKE